jgi:SAM-dependent methyltransferase
MMTPLTASPIGTGEFEFSALNEARNYRHALIDEFRPFLTGSVIEIGAGVGQITGMLRAIPSITRLVSVEPNPEFCAKIRTAWPDQALVQGTIQAIEPGSDWDAILSINVLEHICEDTVELASYNRLLASRSGTLNLFVPARREIYAPIDRDFGHYRRYSKPELKRKLEESGFQIEQLHYFNLVGYFAWWAMFRILKKRTFDARSIRLFDRLIFPCVHGFETRVAAPPLGQSLLAVARASKKPI